MKKVPSTGDGGGATLAGMAWRSCIALLALLLGACQGDGSDIGPEIAELSTIDYRVLVRDDLGRPVVNARVSIEGFGETGATGTRGRAIVGTRPTGTRRLTVDGTHGSAVTSDRLGQLTFAALMPDGDELPYVVYLPDTSGSTPPVGPPLMVGTAMAQWILDDTASSGAIVAIPAGTSVGGVTGPTVELRTGGLLSRHLPGDPPVPASGARLWGAGVLIDPVAITFSPGVALSMPNDLGLPAAATAELFWLDPSTGVWTQVGTGTVDPGATRIVALVGSVASGGLYAFATPVAPTTVLTGRLLDLDNNAVEGALVRVRGATTRSLSDGTFVLPAVAAVDGSGAPLAVTIEVHAGRDWDPTSVSTMMTLTPGQQALPNDLLFDTARVGIVRLQLVHRGRVDPGRRLRFSSAEGLTRGIGIGDDGGLVTYSDQRGGAFSGVLTSRVLNDDELLVSEAVFFMPAEHHLDVQVFTQQTGWWTGRQRNGGTGTFVRDALGSGPVRFAGVVSGAPPDQNFVSTTESGGFANANYGDVGQATASVKTSSDTVTVTSAFTTVDIDTARIELPVERAQSTFGGGFVPHGLVAGQLQGATGGKIHRVRTSRSFDLDDWYEEVFLGKSVLGAVPVKEDPSATGMTAFRVGVPTPVGHLAAVEGIAGGGTFTLERVGLLPRLQPTPGGELQQDVVLDMPATTPFVSPLATLNLHGSLSTADLTFDLAHQLSDGTLLDVVRGVDGNMTFGSPSTDDVTFALPALGGVLSGARHLVAFGGTATSGGKTVTQRTFIPFTATAGPTVRMLDVPDIVSPAPGATVSGSGFSVQFTIPISTLYTIVDLRAQTGSEERVWTAVLPASIDTFEFRQLPSEAEQPLAAGYTWTLTVTAARVETGPLSNVTDAYRRVVQNFVGIGPAEREVNAYSSTSIQVTTN